MLTFVLLGAGSGRGLVSLVCEFAEEAHCVDVYVFGEVVTW